MIPNRLHSVDHFHHVGQTLRWGQPQQRPNVRHIHATLILEGLLLGHSPRIGEKSWLAGCVRPTPDLRDQLPGIRSPTHHQGRSLGEPIGAPVFPRKHPHPRWSLKWRPAERRAPWTKGCRGWWVHLAARDPYEDLCSLLHR